MRTPSLWLEKLLVIAWLPLAFAATWGDPAFAGGALAEAPGIVHPQLWPSLPPAFAADPALEARIDALLADMTVEQKVGQLIQADIGSITAEDLRHYALGSLLNGGNSGPGNNDFAPASEWLQAADRFYDAATDPVHGRHPIPALWGTDAVHGDNNIIGATLFPHNIGLGAARDPDLIRQIGSVTALEVRSTGLDWTFAPTLAVVQDDRWGRTYESYSEDPGIVAAYAAAMVEGLQGKPGTAQFLDAAHVLATAKHFVGDGGTGGRDQGDNGSSESQLRDLHAAGYPPAIAAGAQAVMASFSSWQGVKMHGDRGLLTDVLRGRMHFDGLVVGDWNAHGQLEGCTNTSCPAAINAGIDVLMAPDSWKPLFANTLDQAKSGVIPPTRLDEAVRRVLRVKFRAHLFEEGRPSSRPFAGRFELLGSAEHRAVARRAVRESLVLLKNRGHLLPLQPSTHVLVAGDGANSLSKQNGGWTITWQGTGVPDQDFPHAESIYAGIESAVRAGGGSAELSPSGTFARRPDVAVVVFGENPYAEFQGDLGTLEYSPGAKTDLQLLRRLRSLRIPVVSVFLSGRPLWVNPEINASDAFVAAWLPGSEGGGIADVLFRAHDGSVAHDFRGKLSFSWPRTPQQTAVNRRQPGESALFAYGFGLTYADDGNLAVLPEDPGAAAVNRVENGNFFVAGRAGAGWRWAVGVGASAGVSAHLRESQEISGGVGAVAGGKVRLAAADHLAQEDARRIVWNGNSGSGGGRSTTSVGLLALTPLDLRRESNGQLSLGFDYSVVKPASADVAVAMECGAGCRGSIGITHELGLAPVGQWRHLEIPLACFASAGADMSRVTAPFVVTTSGRLELSVSNIRLETSTDAVMRCAP